MDFSGKKLVVVSNRLPVRINFDGNQWQVMPSPGGLVTALHPIVRRTHGAWIGWAGCSDEAPVDGLLEEYSDSQEYDLISVPITEDEIEQYYLGFSNKTIWPLFHDLLGRFSFDSENWQVYLDVNRKFAETVATRIDENSVVWIHDYQLFFVAYYLRQLGVTAHLNFFLHIPFPSVDLFRRLPWNRDLLLAILSHDHVGFQTPIDRRNFIACVKWFVPEATRLVRKRRSIIRLEDRDIHVGYYPISIDFNEFNEGAKSREAADAAWYLRENLKAPVVVLGLDRLDYTKGIPERFLAFERLLEKYPSTIGQISLLQIVVPSRLKVPHYQELKTRLDGLSGRINARFSGQGWMPIFYQFRELGRVQLLGHYRASDIALITPLRDGMNLVAKEYCASSIDETGVLILSEFAGAAHQLSKGALIVNPYDLDGTADAIYAAYIMSPEEKRQKMRMLRAEIRRYDVKKWVEWFFGSPNSVDHPRLSVPDQEEILIP